MSDFTIRPVLRSDLPALKQVIDATDLFPSEMLDDMIAGYFDDEENTDYWLTYEANGPIGVAYYAPEMMTEGTWNLYLIAIHPDHQSSGHGAALVKHVEETLEASGERLLLVETSGLPAFERTRAFYRNLGFEEEARIRDFYEPGDDKIVFCKAL